MIRRRVLVPGCALVLAALAAGSPPVRAAGTIRTVMTASDDATNPPANSLRDILENVAQPGDTIVFAQNFSLRMDTKFRIRVPADLTGLTIQGPVELRGGVFEVLGDGTTVSGIRFADCRVFGGGFPESQAGAVTEGLSFTGNTFVGDSSLQLLYTTDALVQGNTFDVREPTGDCAVGDYATNGSHWTGNTWTETSKGGFSESDASGFVFDGGNVVHGNALFAPRSGRIEGNTVRAHLRVMHADLPIDGLLEVKGNTTGVLIAHRPDLEVVDNAVSGKPIDPSLKFSAIVRKPEAPDIVETTSERRVTPFSVSAGQVIGDAGTLLVKGNTVDATAKWASGMLVRGTALTGDLVVEGNTITAGKTSGLAVAAETGAVVKGNTITTPGKKGGIVLTGAGAEGVLLEGNTITGGLGTGISILEGTGVATLDGNTVTGCKGVGLQATGRKVVSEDGKYEGCANGVRIGKTTVASIRGGSIAGNKLSGLSADPFSSVEVVKVAFGGNGGAGIDLFPGGCTPNARKKTANGNMPFPETLEYDPATGKAKGIAEPFARVDAYAVEEGARKGNPKNGEGVAWMGEVVAGADGRFTFPAAGRLACPPGNRVTFTATRTGPGADPVTSEFSLDVDCSGVALVLVDRALDGGPGNDQAGATFDAAERHRTMSEDGRFVVFVSKATDLVEGDTNDAIDVFVRDLAEGTTERVSLTPEGGQAAFEFGSSVPIGEGPSISADGRWICYTTRSEGPVDGGGYFYNDAAAILYDRETGTRTIVADPRGQEEPFPNGDYSNYGANYASVSGDGNAVIFTSLGRNYAGADVGDDVDVFVWTRATGAYERVSVPTGGGDPPNGFQASYTEYPRLTFDARFATFSSYQVLSPGLEYGMRPWIRDRQSGTTEAVCIDSTGAIRTGYDPWASDDGRFVAFLSYEALVPEDGNGSGDIYLRDRQAGTTTLVSSKDGVAMYGDSFEPTMSGDGRYVLFRNFGDIWLWDRTTGTKVNVSGSPTVYPNVGCASPRLSRSGQFVQYQTSATNLLDLEGQSFVNHVFLRDLSADE